jgi:hypothetical protein
MATAAHAHERPATAAGGEPITLAGGKCLHMLRPSSMVLYGDICGCVTIALQKMYSAGVIGFVENEDSSWVASINSGGVANGVIGLLSLSTI